MHYRKKLHAIMFQNLKEVKALIKWKSSAKICRKMYGGGGVKGDFSKWQDQGLQNEYTWEKFLKSSMILVKNFLIVFIYEQISRSKCCCQGMYNPGHAILVIYCLSVLVWFTTSKMAVNF